MTRGQFVTFLWRAEGEPTATISVSFKDVAADKFYTEAVAWAVENGITDGMGNNEFQPNTTCKRAQVVTFLYRDLA